MNASRDDSEKVILWTILLAKFTVAVISAVLRGAPNNGGAYSRTTAKDEGQGSPGTLGGGSAMAETDPCLPLVLPPRYRLRDLILGDYAFNDDGERWVRND